MKLTIHTQLLAGVLSILCAGSVFAQCKPYDGYIDHKNGTVTDPRTGTVWMVCALGQTYQAGECKGLATELQWFSAMSAAKAERFLGQSDWRMPTLRDMDSLNDSRANSACTSDALEKMKLGATTPLIDKPTNRTFNNTFSDKKFDPDIAMTNPSFWITTAPDNWPLHALSYQTWNGDLWGTLRRADEGIRYVRFIRAGTPQSKTEFAQELASIPARTKLYDEAHARKETARMFLMVPDLVEAKR